MNDNGGLDDLIEYILEMVLLVDLYEGYEHVPDDLRQEWLERDVVKEMTYHVTGVGPLLTQELLTTHTPDLLFSLYDPAIQRLEKEGLTFGYVVRGDTLVGRLRHPTSGVDIEHPLSSAIEGLGEKLVPYQLTLGTVH